MFGKHPRDWPGFKAHAEKLGWKHEGLKRVGVGNTDVHRFSHPDGRRVDVRVDQRKRREILGMREIKEDTLSELSRGLLARYTRKAAVKGATHAIDTQHRIRGQNQWTELRKSYNRIQGVQRAVDRLEAPPKPKKAGLFTRVKRRLFGEAEERKIVFDPNTKTRRRSVVVDVDKALETKRFKAIAEETEKAKKYEIAYRDGTKKTVKAASRDHAMKHFGDKAVGIKKLDEVKVVYLKSKPNVLDKKKPVPAHRNAARRAGWPNRGDKLAHEIIKHHESKPAGIHIGNEIKYATSTIVDPEKAGELTRAALDHYRKAGDSWRASGFKDKLSDHSKKLIGENVSRNKTFGYHGTKAKVYMHPNPGVAFKDMHAKVAEVTSEKDKKKIRDFLDSPHGRNLAHLEDTHRLEREQQAKADADIHHNHETALRKEIQANFAKFAGSYKPKAFEPRSS